MAASATNTFSNTGLIAVYPHRARRINVNLVNSVALARGTVLGELTPANDVQTLTITGTPAGGTFTLTLNGQTTTAIAYNATATVVAAAVAALAGVGTGNVAGTGGALPGTPVVLTFQGALALQPVNVMTTSGAGLTGGSAPASAVVHTTTGQVPGVYKAYASGNTDGSQIPKGILEFDSAVDASGNITLGTVAAGGQWQQTQKATPMYTMGDFYTTELVGLDANAVTVLGGHLIEGTVSNGVFALA